MYRVSLCSLLALAGCGDRSSATSGAGVRVDAIYAHSIRFATTLQADPGKIVVRCRAEDDPNELHERFLPADSASVSFRGLLADTRYRCTFSADTALGSLLWSETITTATEPVVPPAMQLTVDRGDGHGGYVLFNHWVGETTGQRIFVVDPEGRVRWSWVVPASTRPEHNYQALPDVDARYLPDEELFLVGGGSGVVPHMVDLDGNTVWTSLGPDNDGWYHHHIERLPNGEVLSLLTESTEDPAMIPFEGFYIETRTPENQEVTFSWDGQTAFNAGILPPPPAPGQDAWHANSLSWVEDIDGPAIYISLKRIDRVVRLDRDTGQITWSLGANGNFSLHGADGQPLENSSWFHGQHDPEWSSVDGRLWDVLIYDNATKSNPPSSRILELKVDMEALTAEVTWSWTEEGWYEPLYGDVDRLPSGHVLVTMGHCACSTAGTEHLSALVEVDPSDGSVVWRLQLFGAKDGLYRAEYIDPCILFHNRNYCWAEEVR